MSTRTTIRPCFCFEVKLEGIEPPIWRRFLLSTAATFDDLHWAIQDAFGWHGAHNYSFREAATGREIATLPNEEDEDPTLADATEIALTKFFGARTRVCEYVYDFGDQWKHEVRFVETVNPTDTLARQLLAGARACPKEDSGGVLGYQNCVDLAKTGRGSDVLKRFVGKWDPERFDLAATKRMFDE